MRPHWMTETDERILAYLVETELWLTPKTVAFNVEDITYYQAGNAVRRLRDRGMIETPEHAPPGVKPDGIYGASELGRRFVEGDITLAELRSLTD